MIFHIAIKDLKIIYKDKKALAVMLLMPALIMLILGSSLGRVFSPEHSVKNIPVAVVDNDNGLMSGVFINMILRDKTGDLFTTFAVHEEKAMEMLEQKTVSAVIIIPKGLDKSIEDRMPLKFEVKSGSGNDMHILATKAVVNGFAQNISLTYSGVFSAIDTFEEFDIEVEKQFEGMSNSSAVIMDLQNNMNSEQLDFTESNEEKEKTVSSMQYYGVAMLAMFLLFGANTATRLMVDERENKTLGRIMCAKPSKFTLIAGKFIGLMIICFVQATILISFTGLFYGISWGSSFVGIFVVTLSACFAAAGFGMFISAIAKSQQAVEGLGQIFIQGSTLIGGGMIPIYIISPALKNLSRLTINWWVLNGYHDLMLGQGIITVLPYCLILLIMGVFYLSIGAVRFRV